MGHFLEAEKYFRNASKLGYQGATLNVATIFEVQSRHQEAREELSNAEEVLLHNGDVYAAAYASIKKAALVPRVPKDIQEIMSSRVAMASALQELLERPIPLLLDPPDTLPTLHTGLSKGFFLAYHGFSDRSLKELLASVYLNAIPKLAYAPLHLWKPDASYIARQHNTHNKIPDISSDVTSTVTVDGGNNPNNISRIFVGFISRYFHQHTIFKLLKGVLKHLPRSTIFVVGFAISPPSSNAIDQLRNIVDEVVTLPADLNTCRERVLQWSLDMIIYPELGMDPLAYFLAFSRLAPVQAVWWGHPDTSGIPAIDYFISSDAEATFCELDKENEDFDCKEAEEEEEDTIDIDFPLGATQHHYSERMVRLIGLGTYFETPELPIIPIEAFNAADTIIETSEWENVKSDNSVYFRKDHMRRAYKWFNYRFRKELSIPVGKKTTHKDDVVEQSTEECIDENQCDVVQSPHIYFCPQSVFKLHPEWDQAIVMLLKLDPLGHVVLLEGRQAVWTQLLESRLKDLMSESSYSRVHFIPRMSEARLMEYMAGADVLLDPFPFGGGVTSLQGFSLGTPIITFPSLFVRGRLTLAMYRKMNEFSDIDFNECCIARNDKEYATKAVELANNVSFRKTVSENIIEQNLSLFEDDKAIFEWERLIISATRGKLYQERQQEGDTILPLADRHKAYRHAMLKDQGILKND